MWEKAISSYILIIFHLTILSEKKLKCTIDIYRVIFTHYFIYFLFFYLFFLFLVFTIKL